MPPGGKPGDHSSAPRQRSPGAGHAEVRDGLPGRRRCDGDGGRDPGAEPAGLGAGQLDGHRRPHLDPGRVQLRSGVLRGCGLQPAGVAQPDPGHQGRRGRLHRVGPAGRRASRGRRGAGGRGDVRVVRADDLHLDGQAPGGLPGGCGRDLAGGGGEGDGPAGPGRAGRGDLCPVPAREPRRRKGRGVRGPVGQARDHVRRRGGPACRPDPGVRLGRQHRA